jgi:hypothetical protein
MGRGSRLVKPLLGALLALSIVFASGGCSDFVYPCTLPAPKALPDGSAAGVGVRDDSVLTGATRWGTAPNAVHVAVVSMSPQAIQDVHPTPGVTVRGVPAHIQDAGDPPSLAPAGAPALIWQEQSCRYTVVLDASMTPAQAADFAARF